MVMPHHRGLQFDEPLLKERSVSGRYGVDLPSPSSRPLRTGQPERNHIGLPEISEPQVVRHFVRLSQMNFSIDTGFYPLGSCTMKHNPRLNEKMARLPKLSYLHPLQEDSTTQGTLALMHHLQEWLSALTGLPGVTLNPAAGAHGELTGLMMIRKAHEISGEKRSIVLVPDSAHGTNPATAAMCGYTIVPVPTTAEGWVDVRALERALSRDVAAFMLTNPSTVGLFDPHVLEISNLLKQAGAYFYCDGANFNAIAGRIRPADFGVDIMHINLHKTFSTPHGGGGPGSGPIVASSALMPFLPVPRVVKKTDGSFQLITEDPKAIGRVRAFQGHFGMVIRALSYMLAHGGDGIRQASEDAVLNANYVLAHLKDMYHTPFDGPCMHECLLSDKFQRPQGIDTMDIAKTLIENGIHPMTVFFPLVVKGAMLIEPTESETLEALDHFIQVMRDIATSAKAGDIDAFKHNPVSTPRKRVNEIHAVKHLKVKW